MGKRIISLLLTVIMIISMFPVNAFAEEGDNTGGNGQRVVDTTTESATEPTIESEANDGEEKKMTAEDLAALFRALPEASSITADTTEAEKSAIMAQLEAAVTAYNNMVENDSEEAARFEENYAQLYFDAMDLNDALTGNEWDLYATIDYDPDSSRNLTITVNNNEGQLVTGATITVTRNGDTFTVAELGNGQYAFTKNSTSNTSTYTITVSAPGHESSSITVRGRQSSTTVTLNKLEDLTQENWVDFRVFYIATGELPDKYAGAGDATNYGPSANNTPLVVIKVDINKLRREHSDVALYQENTDGNQYHFIPVGAAKDEAAAQRFWTAVKDCMHPDSVADFTATGLYNDYCVYVLKKQGDGSQHADGILSKTPPVYVIELYSIGTYFGGFVSDQNSDFATMDQIRAKYNAHIESTLGAQIHWDENGRTGYYLTDDNAYSVTLTQTNENSANHKPAGSEISYQSRNNTNTYYLATFNLTVTEGAEGFNTVRYTDGVANDTLFPDQVDVLTTGSKVPAFTGDPHGKRPGYNFVGWILEGGDGKILSDAEVTAMDVNRNLVFHAEWARIPTEFTATITVLLNDTYPSDIFDMLGNSNAALYVKADGGNYIPLTRSDVGVYTAELPNGTYKTYYSVDGGSNFAPIDDRVFAIASAEGGRRVKFNSVSYDLDGGTSNPVIPQLNFYHAGTAVHVNSTAPTKEGYVFMGWKNSDGVIYQPGEQITDYIVAPYRLTAQWKKAIDVTVTVVIEHGNDDTPNNDNVTFSLVELQQGTTVHTGKSVSLTEENRTGYEISENTETKTITYTPTEATFRDLPDANYTVNCFKAAYEITVSKETDNDGNQHITLTLKYTPDDFALNFVVQMDESAMDDKNLWPQAARVKAVRWEKSGETTNGWEVVPQHQSTSALVAIDPATGKGSGSVNVAKHWPGDDNLMADYRIVVTAYIMPDGTTVTAQPVPGFKWLSSNGIYEGVITVENGGRTPTYPEATDALAAFYNNESKAQDGIPTATIKVNSFDVTFKADTVRLDDDSFGKVKGNATYTVPKQIKIPQFENFEMTAPADGYLFEGWYSKDGTATGDWGEKIVAGTDITGSVTVYAKWKAPITITGDVYVSAHFTGDDGEEAVIFDHDRVRTVTLVLRHQGLGGHIKTVDVAVTYTGNLGKGTYEFKNIPDDGNIYYIEERTANYTGRYQNEPDSLTVPEEFDSYKAEKNIALLEGDLVAQVNAYLDFDPASFDLQYQVDATAISEDFRPEVAEILVTSEGTSTSPAPSQWPVILQMISGKDAEGKEVYAGDMIALTDGKGGGSTSVWNSYPDGATLYEYGIRLNSVEGLGSHTGTDAPYSVKYEDPAYYITGGQSKILKAILIPNQYAVIYDLGIDETAVTGMENAPKLHTWSVETAIDVAPRRMGYEFLGWYDNAQFTGDPVTKIDASVSEDTTLYAKWLQVQDKVDMTVTIIHTTADGGRASNYNKNLEVQLTHAPKDKVNVPYEDVSGQTKTYTSFYWHTLDDDTTEDVFGVNEIFSKLSSAYAYSLNVSLEGYYVTEKKVTPIVDPDSGATTYDVEITLQYNPDLLQVTVNAKMAEGIARDLWPVSAEVKINSWSALPDENIPIGWNTITQHYNTTLTITLDESGRGNVSYPVWQWESQKDDKPYYYRMEVVSLHLSDGTIVLLDSSDDVVYAGGNYMATIETDADCARPSNETELYGIYGTENSSGNGYVQTGTITAVISTDIWQDETPDHMQAAIAFKSADETMGKVEGELLQVFDLEEADGTYKKTVKPETVEAREVPGYEFTHWTDEDGATIENPFVDQELVGGNTYTYTAHWKKRTDLAYTVNYLDDQDNSILAPKTVTGMTFGNTVYSSGEVVEITGYVFERADVESIQIGVNSNVINLYYAKDDNGDKIPDYKQVFVNFVSGENGSVSGAIEQVFTLAEVNGQYTGWITPEEVTATADTGYTFLKWTDKDGNEVADPFLSMEVEGGQSYTFTAHWTIRQDYSYIVQYLDKQTGKALVSPKNVTDQQYNSTVSETAIAITGYTLDGAASQTITLDTDGKVITFYYNILDNLTLTVHHLELGTNTKLHDETYVHSLRFGAEPDMEVLRVNIHGYQYKSTDPVQITIRANNDDNVVTIYYEKAQFQYQYQHYYEGVLDESRTTYGTAKYGTVIDTYTESKKDGYALDYIVGLPLTVDGYEAQNVIKLYYAKDVYSEEGEESDGIPDKYQATVRYRIVNGTWSINGSGSADIVQYYTLYTGDAVAGWTKKVPAPTLRNIPDGEGNTGYQANGQWDHHFNDQTAVTKDVVYTLSFDHIHYTISAQVFNGTAKVDGETFLSPYEYHYDDKETTTIVVVPFAGYVLEKVEVDGSPAVLTNDSYTFNHNDGDHSITVVYGVDANNNGTPDKYEATVTFYIVNGTWADGKTDPIEELFLLRKWENGQWVETPRTLEGKIPADMIAAETYDAASGLWLQGITEETPVTQNAFYTYAFANLKTYLLDVTVVNGTASGGGEAGEIIDVEVEHNPDASTTFTFTPAKDHVLDRVTVDGKTVKMEGNTYTLKHDSRHSMVVVYAEDKNGNGTPDKYDATVTYNVVNGTWEDGTSASVSHVFALYEMDDSGVWQPTNATLGSTIPAGMIAAAGHHGGAWNTGIDATTPVTRNASYTFSFILDYYLINAVVINGSASVNGKTFTTETVPYSADGKTIINFAPNDDATHHYIVESVMVDEELLNLTPEELKNFNSYEFNHLTNHHIRVAYTLDNNRDNIPDKYQKKVTFRIIHGTWDDDKTVEKSIYVNLMKDGKYDAEGAATVDEPGYEKIPATGYVGGDWDVTFPRTVTGTEEVIYTFTFNQKQQIRIIIDVVGGTSFPVHSDTVYDYDTGEHAITFQPYDGYVLDSAQYKVDDLDKAEWNDLPDFTGTVNHDHTRNHHIRVVYKPDTNDDGTADYKQVFVKFVSADSTMGIVDGDNAEQVLAFADTVTPKSEKVNTKAVDGYTFDHWTDASGNTVDPFAGFSAEGGMTYVFTANWKQLDLDYVIHYVDEEGKQIRTSKIGTMHYGDQILAEDEAVDITDHVFIRGDKDVLNIALEEDKNVLTLIYGKDLWKDTPTGEDSETGGDDIPDSRQSLIRFVSSDVTKGTVTGHGTVQVFTIVDESKVVTPSSVTVTPAVGYILSHWVNTENGEELGDPFVPMFVTGGMVKEYAAHWAKRTDLSYTVNYLDLSGKLIAEAKTVTNVTFEEEIASAIHVKNIDGYVFDHADSDSIVVGVGSNVINLYYAQDVNKDNTADYKQFFVYFTAGEGGEVKGQTTQVFTLPEVNGKYTGTVTPVRADSAEDATGVLVVAHTNYAEDYWSRDGEVNAAVNPFAELTAEGGKSVTFTVHFAADANGDNTPDKHQAVVTYRIIGGFWENKDNQDIVEYIPISQQNENLVWVPIIPAPTLGDTVPDVAKAIADASLGLTAPGHWGEKEDTSDDPTSTTVAKDKDVYTFTFAERIPYNVTVTVENGSFTVGGESVFSPIVVRYDDDLKIDFAAKVEEGKNYVIESVTVDDAASELDEDGSISFADIREDHTVHVVYGLDIWADPEQDKDPTKPGDGISDNFQIKVNYHAVPAEFGRVSLDSEVHTLLDANGKPAKQGAVELTGSEAIANSADENGRNVFVNWTDTVTAPAPGEVPGAIGTNAVLKQKLENVNGGSEYHYYANFRHEMKIAAIYFVEYYLWNENQHAYVLDEESTFLGRGYVGDEVKAQIKTYAGFAVNPSNSVLKGIITEPAADPNTQLPANVLTLKIYYDVDQGGEGGEVPDGIPDIYQKKITFKVVNGTFSNAAKLRSTATTAVTERVVYLTLRDEQGNLSANGKAKLTAPTDMKADAGYQGGKWDQTPPEEVSGTEAVTYTYRFSKIPALNTPKTGDNSNITVWVAVMIVSFAGVIVILFVICRKKRHVK